MIERVHFVRIEKHPCLLIPYESVILPRIPQAAGNLQKLGGNPVTFGMVRMLFLPIVECGAFQGGSHDIPACTAAANPIQGGELTGDGERLAVRSG
ncbi:hypothetical protein D3C81_1441330 [compost metagenome]